MLVSPSIFMTVWTRAPPSITPCQQCGGIDGPPITVWLEVRSLQCGRVVRWRASNSAPYGGPLGPGPNLPGPSVWPGSLGNSWCPRTITYPPIHLVVPPSGRWDIERRSKPLGVLVYGEGFPSEFAAKLAGEKALRELLDGLADLGSAAHCG